MPGPLEFAQGLGAARVLRRAAAVQKAEVLTNCIGKCNAAGVLNAAENAAHDRERFR